MTTRSVLTLRRPACADDDIERLIDARRDRAPRLLALEASILEPVTRAISAGITPAEVTEALVTAIATVAAPDAANQLQALAQRLPRLVAAIRAEAGDVAA